MMKLNIVLLVVVCLVAPPVDEAAQALPPSHCSANDTCGDVKIPYPFGISKACRLNDDFAVTCNTSFNSSKPFLQSTINITGISLHGELRVLTRIARQCYDGSGIKTQTHLRLRTFSLNDTLNKFVVVGCDSIAYLRGTGLTTGCMSICSEGEVDRNGACDGVGCCQTPIRKHMQHANLTVGSFDNHSDVMGFNPCTYAFLIEDAKFHFSPENLTNLQYVEKLPVVFAWTIGDETCEEAKKNTTSYACQANSSCYDVPDGYSGYRCSCLEGYDGNPYLGCKDIDECRGGRNNCTMEKRCTNTAGNYTCSCPKGYSGDGWGDNGCKKNKIAYIVIIGVAFGVMIVLLITMMVCFELKRRSSEKTKQKFFHQNGGVFLQEKLRGREGTSPEMVKIFTSVELQKATNDFNNDMVLGQGGFGIVFKGFLPGNRVVAIKKSRRVDANEIEKFINEVIVLSQINHRNVVRLLGCCLETELPHLVYEFIDNGTLSSHLHNQEKARFLDWGRRLKIAADTAGVLSYLHSAASTPIIHSDVKTDNILLDNTFTAKVSDFGASKLVPLDQTQIMTVVQGTFGYLDPEYMQTHQLTEKSDVYSFGVVLAELLTGRRAIGNNINQPEEERSLVNLFLSLLKQGRLVEILDENVVGDGNVEEVEEVADLAKVCLSMRGDDRPSMKEVAMELEGLIIGGKKKWAKNSDNYEEMESLLQQNEGIHEFAGCDGNRSSVGYDSIRNHVVLPVSGGR